MIYWVFRIRFELSPQQAAFYQAPSEGTLFYRNHGTEPTLEEATSAVEEFYDLPSGVIDVVEIEPWDQEFHE